MTRAYRLERSGMEFRCQGLIAAVESQWYRRDTATRSSAALRSHWLRWPRAWRTGLGDRGSDNCARDHFTGENVFPAGRPVTGTWTSSDSQPSKTHPAPTTAPSSPRSCAVIRSASSSSSVGSTTVSGSPGFTTTCSITATSTARSSLPPIRSGRPSRARRLCLSAAS